MCSRHSFIVTKSGQIFDGHGITDSHTTIRELAGLSPENDDVNAYEWQPPDNWPESDWTDGLYHDYEVFDLKKSHLVEMEAHVRRLYPTMAAWEAPDVVRDITVTSIKGEFLIPPGATVNAPNLISAHYVELYNGATFNAPLLKATARAIYLNSRSTFNAPALETADAIYVLNEATLNGQALTSAKYVDVRRGGTLIAPKLVSVGQQVFYEGSIVDAPVLQR